MKPFLPASSKSNIGSNAFHLIEVGKVVSDPSAVFNEYVSTPVIGEPVLSLSMDYFENHPSTVLIRSKSINLDFSFSPVTSAYVADLLVGLNVKKSCGPDGFSRRLLKIAAPAIALALTGLFNYCIESSQW